MSKKSTVKGFSPVRKYAFNEKAETQGVWFDLEGDAKILVARYGNAEQVKLERQLESEYRKQLESEDTETVNEARIELNRRVFSQTVLVGWKNFVQEDGETPLEYSQEAAEELLHYPEFFGAVFNCANDLQKFRKYQEEQAVKNS